MTDHTGSAATSPSVRDFTDRPGIREVARDSGGMARRILIMLSICLAFSAHAKWDLGFIPTRIIRLIPGSIVLTDSARASLLELGEQLGANPGHVMVIEYPRAAGKNRGRVFEKEAVGVRTFLCNALNQDRDRFVIKSAVTLSPDRIRIRMPYQYEHSKSND